jgi:hypothetical protein
VNELEALKRVLQRAWPTGTVPIPDKDALDIVLKLIDKVEQAQFDPVSTAVALMKEMDQIGFYSVALVTDVEVKAKADEVGIEYDQLTGDDLVPAVKRARSWFHELDMDKDGEPDKLQPVRDAFIARVVHELLQTAENSDG